MFTGIIEATGVISQLQNHQGDLRIKVQSNDLLMDDVGLGDSIATNGVCLTVVERFTDGFSADVSNETTSLTCFAHYKTGQKVNLEKAMQASSRFGGHMVSGHVDGIAKVESIQANARATDYWLSTAPSLMKYIPYKGSVCIDGISLTVNGVEDNRFKLTIVPHTAEQTTMADFKIGQLVNLEVDQIARYLECLLKGEQKTSSNVSMELLAKAGFLSKK